MKNHACPSSSSRQPSRALRGALAPAAGRLRLDVLFYLALVSILAASGYFALSRRAASPFVVPEPRAPRAEYQDMALACLTMGTASPAFEELEGGTLDSVLAALAWVLESHHAADFEAYLQMHREDLAWAESVKNQDAGLLAQIIERDLGHPAADVPAQWLPALELFWSLLYAQPVLQDIAPETSRFALEHARFEAGAGEPDLAPFWAPFEERRASYRRRINHEIAIPHRRSPEDLARESGELAWFDFQVDVVLGQEERLPSSLLLRFVWDGADGDWFLARAVTIYPDHLDPGSTRSLLLF